MQNHLVSLVLLMTMELGMEAEIILQMGTEFEVAEIKQVSGKITVVLKVLK
jgi:hypothetical protein